ncbi:MAG: S-layer homology domain-containing protein, partial [Cyanobacteria bacterium]|nr:S-layer homology domain-containing protein [Cyanobacteriota bacterium]
GHIKDVFKQTTDILANTLEGPSSQKPSPQSSNSNPSPTGSISPPTDEVLPKDSPQSLPTSNPLETESNLQGSDSSQEALFNESVSKEASFSPSPSPKVQEFTDENQSGSPLTDGPQNAPQTSDSKTESSREAAQAVTKEVGESSEFPTDKSLILEALKQEPLQNPLNSNQGSISPPPEGDSPLISSPGDAIKGPTTSETSSPQSQPGPFGNSTGPSPLFGDLNPTPPVSSEAGSTSSQQPGGPTNTHHSQTNERVYVFMNNEEKKATPEKSSPVGMILGLLVALFLIVGVGVGIFLAMNPTILAQITGQNAPPPPKTQTTTASPTPPKTPTPPVKVEAIVIPPAALDLTDIPRQEVIQDLISLNLVSAPERKFNPTGIISRGEYVVWLVNSWNRTHSQLNNLQYVGTDPAKFPDISENQFTFRAIQMLSTTGYLYGYEDGSFKPNQAITREEMLYMDHIIQKLQRTPATDMDHYYSLIQERYADGKEVDPKYAFAIVSNEERAKYIWGKTELIKPKALVKRYEAALSLNTLQQECAVTTLASTLRKEGKFDDTCNAHP